MPRYVVFAPAPNVAQRSLGSALTPGMTRPAQAWSSRGPIFGQPGTMAVSAPRPSAIPNDRTAQASMGVSRSSDAPPVIFPSIYYIAGVQEHAPVSRVSDNQMPIPAMRPDARIPSDPYVTRKGGNRQIYQPQIVPTWPPLRGTSYA